MPAQFIVDENLVRVGRAMKLLRHDVRVFGDPEVLRIAPLGALDTEWIAPVARQGFIVITDDGGLRVRPTEAPLCIQHNARVIHLYRAGNLRPWDQFLRLVTRWRVIEKHIDDNPHGPWWLSVRAQQVKPLRYEPGSIEP